MLYFQLVRIEIQFQFQTKSLMSNVKDYGLGTGLRRLWTRTLDSGLAPGDFVLGTLDSGLASGDRSAIDGNDFAVHIGIARADNECGEFGEFLWFTEPF